MRRRSLGGTGIEVSEIGLGTWGLGGDAYGPVDDVTGRATIERALELGVDLFDASPTWGRGRSEEMLGEVLAGRRDQVVLVTRAGIDDGGLRPRPRFTPGFLQRSVEASLRRLRTDRIDVLLLHGPDEEVLETDPWLRGIERMVSSGKIGTWGVSVGTADQALAGLARGASVVCLPYNLLYSGEVHSISGELAAAGCGLLARSALAYGLLAGRWETPPTFGETDHRRRRWDPLRLTYRIGQVDALRFLVSDEVPDLASAALRYVLANTMVSSLLAGPRSPAQLEHAVASAEGGSPYLPVEVFERLPTVLREAGITTEEG